ncbi:hypothetical protein SLE2022_304270 [Rubroshorea leprosula]
MAERKLNLNAPLLSVRRSSSTLASSKGEKGNAKGRSVLDRRYSLPVYKSGVSLDQVAEPGTIPFMWEHIPGKAKGGVKPESNHSEQASVTPRLPPGRALDVIKYPLEKEFENQDVVRSPNGTCSANDNVAKFDCSREGTDRRWRSDQSEHDEDVYSDALDTLSPTDSLSLNCSISGLSGSGDAIVKPSGAFSMDSQTCDFMMSRFLPAAKAMALEPPQNALKKQPPPVEQPREAKQVVAGDRKPAVNQCESIIIPHYDQGVYEEETESEGGDYNASGNLTSKGCGLFPRLCFKNSLCLLNPVPGLKVRTHSPTSSSSLIRKLEPGKAAYKESHSQTVKKHAWNAAYKLKLDRGVQSPKLPRIENKLTSASSHTNSCVRQPKLAGGAQSHKPPRIENKLISASSLANSSDRQPKLDSGAQSPKLPKIGNKLTPASSQFPKSSEQQISRSSSPYRLSGGSRISPYRRERPQSPFRGGGFLGVPKVAENIKANMLNKDDRISNKYRALSSHQSFKQWQPSGSASSAEKTSYVNTEIFAELSSAHSNSSDIKGQMEYSGKSSEVLLGRRVLEETGTLESSLEGIKCLNISEKSKVSEHNHGPMDYKQTSSSDMPNIRGQAKMMRCLKHDGGIDQETKALECIKVVVYENLNLSTDNELKADDQGECKGVTDPSPPPLPKTPSESWLWRTLPSVTSQNPLMRTYTGTRFRAKREEPKAASTNSTWETIVKTSYLHHDHVRYSEELVTHVSQQPRT